MTRGFKAPTRLNANAIINRPELPIVQRGGGGGEAVRILLIVLVVLAGIFIGPKLLKLGGDDFAQTYRIESSELKATPVGQLTSWLVSGTIINQSSTDAPAPDLEIRLLRSDKTLAARSALSMNAQIIPAHSGLPFQTRIATSGNETLTVDIRPIKPASGEERRKNRGQP